MHETTNNYGLSWVQVRLLKHNYELRSNDKTITSISWEIGHEATAMVHSENNLWILKLPGHNNTNITARVAGQNGFVAQFRSMTSGEGVLLVENGCKYYWVKEDLSSNERWLLLDESHRPVMTLKSGICLASSIGNIAYVSVDKQVMASPYFPLVASMGLLALILHREYTGDYRPKEEVYLNMGFDKRMATIFA